MPFCGNVRVGGERRFVAEQIIHPHAEQTGKLRHFPQFRLGRAAFPFGDRLAGYAQPVGQLLLGPALLATQSHDLVG